MKKIKLLFIGILTLAFIACEKPHSNLNKFIGEYNAVITSSGNLMITNQAGQTSNAIQVQAQDISFIIERGSNDNDVIITFTTNSKYNIINFPETLRGTIEDNILKLDEFTFDLDFAFIGFHDISCTYSGVFTIDNDGNITISGTTTIIADENEYVISGELIIHGFGSGQSNTNTTGTDAFLGNFIGIATTIVDSSYIITPLGNSNFDIPESLAQELEIFDHEPISFTITKGDENNRVWVKINDLEESLPNTIGGTINDNQLILDPIVYDISLSGVNLSTTTTATATIKNNTLSFIAKTSGLGQSEILIPGEIHIILATSGEATKTILK